MKEFQKKSLAMLFALFMLGACSTSGGLSAGDEAMNEALGELDVDTTGMTQWRDTMSGSEDGGSYSITEDYYFGTDTYAHVYYYKNTMGSYWCEGTMAHSGDLKIITEYTLKGSDDSTIADKDGYEVYAFTSTDSYFDSDGNFPEDMNEGDEVYVEYILVKISGSTMHEVSTGSYDAESKTYTLEYYGEEQDGKVTSLADAGIRTYTKK